MYEPYSNDKKWMEREGDPCRHCLRPFHDHHNGQCPKEEGECPSTEPRPT